MNWREYQDIVGHLYEQAEGIGIVHRNVTRPDKVTGQARQIDTLIEIEAKGHTVSVLIDAKFHKDKIDVKTVEEVLALADAVGANKAVVVCANGWTEPAEKRAAFSGLDLKLLLIEEAVEFLDPDKWQLCPSCETDCIVMDHDGVIELKGLILWWLAGQCRQCRTAIAWCQDCGDKVLIEAGETYRCNCGHLWAASLSGMTLTPSGSDELIDF
jgi:hypothetical protein